MYLFFHLVGELLHVVEPCSWVATLKQLNEAYFDFISLTFTQCMQFVKMRQARLSFMTLGHNIQCMKASLELFTTTCYFNFHALCLYICLRVVSLLITYIICLTKLISEVQFLSLVSKSCNLRRTNT